MAVMPPNSAQRSMRKSRSDLSSKRGAPSLMKAALSTTDIKGQAEGLTENIAKEVSQVESSQEQTAPSLVPPLEAQQQPLVAVKQEAASTSSTTILQRRSMQRARKPSSRLLPSPSPPPTTRSVSYNLHHHHSPSKAASLSTVASSAPKNMQKKQQAATPTLLAVTETVVSDVGTSPTSPQDEKEFGPGKRKRRPSTMSKPPSTITKQAPVSQSSISLAPSSGPTSLKIRLNRVASKSQSPEERGQSSKGQRKAKAEEGTPVQPTGLVGHGSEGTAEGVRIGLDGDIDHEEDSDAGPSIVPAPRRIGHVRIKVHPLSAAREKFGGRRWPTSSGTTLLEPPPLISRRGALKATHPGLPQSSQRSVKIGGSESTHQRSQSTSVLDGRWAWNPSAIAPTLRFRLSGHAGDEEVSEASDLDDEDDFHVAMLDGGDFGDARNGKAASPSSKGSHRDSKSGDESEGEDTPATTPRSPQSTCDLPERRWSTGADDEEKETCKAKKDAVFAHALETSSRRPHTHAGSLTLSLPFEEMTQGSEEDPATSTTKESVVAQTELATEDDDSHMPAGLLSPAVQHTILGLSAKQHALMLSSPRTDSSAFTSPALDPSIHDIKTEPLPLSLPPPASLSQAREKLKKQMKAKHAHLMEMSSSALHSDDEADEAREVYEHAILSMDPPERMCLSELDRAWEQSEYLVKARRMAGDPKDESRSEADVIGEPPVDKEVEIDMKDEVPEVIQRSTRGSKRLSIAATKDEPEAKKPKTSPKSKVAPSPGRRSARNSGIKS